MQTNKETFFKSTTGILAFFLVLTLILLYIKGIEDDNRIQSLQSALRESKADIEYHKNKEGKLIAEKAAAEQSVNDLKRNMKEFSEQVSKALDIKVKNIRAGLIASFQAKGEGEAKIEHIPFVLEGDSGWVNLNDNQAKFEPFALIINDGYLSEQIDVYPDSSHYNYAYSDTLTFAFHTKQKWLLGRKQLYSSGSLSNPNAVITNSKAVLVKEYKDKRFGIGPYVGYGFDGVSIGIAVQYSLIKF